MAQEIDITGLKKNFNTTVVGDSVIVITQYAVRTVYNRQYYPQSRVYEFNNRPVEAVNYLTFETPLIVTRPSTRLILSGTATNNAILVTGQSVLRAGTSTQVNSVNTASLFVKGSNPIRIPINSLSGGVATVNTFTDILGQPNIYGVAAAGTGTWAFAIEQLPPTQVAGLSINSIITVNTSSNSTGNFGSGNTAYIQSINPNQIIVVASGGTTPVNGTIDGITPTGGTATPSSTGYTVHIFTSNGNFVSTSSVVADVLIVGGGGAGGFGHGAGGGGGAVIYGSSKTISSGTYVVVVGQGGVQSTSNASNNSGGSSSIFGITATGGGAGANEPGDDTSGRSGTGSPGANGGGGGYGGAAGGVGTAPTAAGYSVYAGNAGAPGYSVANFNFGMGGGGGAGGTPTQPSILLGGAGGSGVQIGPITDGVNNYYWGGGGGGTTFGNSNGGTGGSGGLGGGGGATVFGAGAPYPTAGLGGGSAYNSGAAGSVTDSGTGGAGGANTGGGGGGGSNENGQGGAGGSGIVVVRYTGAQKATGGIISSVNSAITIPTFRAPNPVGWIFTITNLASTIGYNIGDVISHVGRTGTLGSTSSLVYLTGINTASNSISGISFGSTAPKLGNINAVYPTGESLANVVVSNVSTSTPYTFVVSGLKSTSGLIAGNPGSVITATNVTGSFGAGNTVIVQAILGYTSLLAYVVSGISAPIPGIITNFTATGATLTLPVVGQIAYTTTGTYSWTAPAEVTSVSVVAVGGGGGGSTVWSGGGGGGGGLGWKNNIAVTPGQTYTVVVGTGGPPTSNTTNAAAAGGTSFFISTATVAGYGGGRGGPNSTAFGGGYGGGYFGDSGGRGGNGAFQGSWNYGGAGAGGYSGNGADSNGGTGGVSAPTGSGGGAAGGYYSSTQGVPAGGGVGILGRGADGTASGQFNGGGGGSGGQQGRGGEASGQQGPSIINGGAFGGGGGGSGTSYGGGWGGVGAVRIIWGTGRSFPVTLTADQGSQPTLPTIITSFKNENVGGSSFVYPSSRIESIPLVLQQNNVPTITPVVVNDPRRLVLQRQVISKTGSEFSLRNSFTFVNINVATTSQYFSTGTLSFTMPVTTNPGGVGFIGTVTQIPILPNIYGVAVASISSWAFAVENIASTQTSSLSFGRIVTASTSLSSTGNFGTGNTVWVYSTATTGVVVLIASGGSTPPVNGSIDGLTITGGIYNPPLSTNVDLLLVGGGGSGGNHSTTNGNGGGGAGGLLYGTNINLTIGSYPIVIGQGGAAISNATAGNGNRGTSSTFGTIYIANGGGGGGSTGVAFNAAVNNGGSGGGKAESQTGPGLPTQTSQSGATGYGNQGGANSQGWTGAGGGGAGSAGVGGSGGTAPAGDGGQGRAYDISGTMRWYAGGGGGGGNSSERAGDGYAGGGRGAGTTLRYAYNVYTAEVNSITTGSGTPNAIPNTGGGGGGGSYWAPNGGWGSGSGAGGSGIAIVRYLGGQAGSGGTITSAGGYTIHTFTSDGTFVFNGSYGLAVPTFRAPVQSPWIFAITGTSVAGFTTGSVISATPRIGTFGSNNEVYVTSVDTSTNSINCFAWAKGTNSAPPSRGLINAIYPTGELTVLNPIISGITTYGSGYRFTISNIRGTLLYNTGTIFTATPITGTLGTGSTAVVFGIDSFTQIQAYTYGGTAPVAGFIGTPTLSASTATIPQSGDIAYITTGTYSWTAPAGVTSVSVVAVGGGGAGWSAWANAAGAGGGLGWKNNISVTPGNSYTVVVGAGGVRNGGAGGTSFFISTATVAGYGGGNASSTQNTSGPNANGYGGGWVGDGGGAGGNSTNYQGGGGAGGYTGNGGNQGNLPAADSGGAAGGGYYSSTYGSGSGGGVGIWGKGATATGWWHGSSGQVFSTSQGNGGGGEGGSGGERGRSGENPTNSTGESGNVNAPGGRFGGGGAGPGSSWTNAAGSGGGGAVRIIWGPGRAFPATNAGTLTSVVSVATTVFVTKDDNIGGDSNTREALMSISTPRSLLQNTVPTQVLVNANSSIRSTIKNYVHVPTNLTNSSDYESAPSITTSVNSSTTGTYIYRSTAISEFSWIFRIYNISSATVSSLTTGTIITANTSSVNSGNFGVGSTVTVYSVVSATSIIAVAYGGGGSSAPVQGPIDSISVPGGTYIPPTPVGNDQNYTTPGTYTFIVPSNATTLSAMAVGGGGAGDDGNSGDGGGGGGSGGSAGFFNGLAVTPGQTLTIVVGAGGAATSVKNTKAPDGGLSSVTFGSFTMTAPGGIGGSPYTANPGAAAPSAPSFANTPGGVTTGGFAGGAGGGGFDGGGGGGGAGGLAGAGGTGAYSSSGSATNGGSGAGGGGGTASAAGIGVANAGYAGGSGGSGQNNVTGGGGGGSATYTPAVNATAGGNGNGLSGPGTQGGAGGFPGGGGGGSWDTNNGTASAGGGGFVRLVWSGTVQAYTGSSYIGTSSTPVNQYQVAFNGTSQYLSIPANTAFAFGTGDFTVEAWVYLTVNAGSRLVNTRATGGAASGTWSFSLSPTTMGFTEVIGGEPGPTATFSSILNTWKHVAAVRSGGVTKLYLNGTQVGSATQTTNFNNSSYPLYIATSPSENFIGGYVSNLRIVKGTAVYTSAFTTPTVALTAIPNTVLLTCKSATFVDLSVNALTITPTSSPTISVGTLSLSVISPTTTPTPLEDRYLGKQTAFVAVVPVSSSTSYFKNRSFTARLQSPGGLPNNLGIIRNVTPSPISGSSATIYNTTQVTPTVWAFGIYNLTTATVTSLTYGAIITIGSDQGNTGTGNTVYFYTATNNTSIVAVATDGNVAPANGYITGITVTGGTYTPTSSPAAPTSMEYFVVGGGGGAVVGGGGAGGVTTGTSAVTAEYRYNVLAGGGGASGQQGFGSAFEQVTVLGGGFGGASNRGAGVPGNGGGSGASGGGGGSPGSTTYQFQQSGAGGGGGTAGQGNSGGSGGWWAGSNTSGGGGGGFTGAGASGSGVDQNGAGYGGAGGSGTTSTFSGSSVTYARGGGGWGAYASGTPSGAGAPGTGNGGGAYNAGGTGIVMIRYPSSAAPAWSVTGNPTVNVTGGYRIYSWVNTTTNATIAGTIQFAGPSGYIVPNLGVPGAPGPWIFSLTDMNTTAEFRVGSVVAATPITGSFGSNNTVRVLSITSGTALVCSARSGEVAPSIGTVAYIQPTGAIDNGPEISAVSFAAVGSWTFVVSNLTSTIMMQVGSVINATTASGSLASFGTGTTAFVSSILNISQISAIAMGGTAPIAGVIDNVSTSGAVVSFTTGSYATLTFVTGGNLTVTNNGTTDVTIFKTSGSSTWDNEARVAQAFTAPCTLEFFKQADSSDNGSSYAMMGWNDDPTANASYTTLDYTAYPYRTDAYSVHHNGSEVQYGGQWDPAKKFYIVYGTDGFIRHYNGATLLYSVSYGTGRTVYVDSSFYSPNGTFGGFRNIRVKTAAWQGGLGYGGYGSADYSIVKNTPGTGRQDNWDNIVANVTVNTLNRPVNYFGNEVTEPKLVISNAATASIRNAVVPMFELGVTPGNITDITTVTSTTWSFTIDGMRSTSGFTTGTIINSTAVVGSFGLGNQVTVTGVTSSTAMTCITSFGTMIPLAGSITGIYATGEIEPTGPYIEKVIGVNQLSNTTSYSVSFSSAFSSYLQYPNSTQFNLATAGTRWTAECWLKPTGDYSIYNTIFCKRVSGSGTTSYEGYLRITTGAISFYNGTEYVSDYTLTPNVWSHCAWVYTGSVLNIYVNGVVRYSVSLSLGADNTEPLLIGQARGYTEYFNGLMSNFRLVKNLAVYTGNFTPPTSPLSTTQTDSTNIAAISTDTFTSLLVCQTNTFTDRSVYNTATTVVGTPSISIDNPFGSTSTLTGPWSYVISGLTSTNAFFSSAIVTATSVVGSIGTGTSYVNFVINNRQIAVLNNTVDANIIPGTITNVSTSGVITSTSSPTAVRQVEFNTSPPTSGGTGKYLTTPSTANYNLGTGGDFTVECWIYLTSNGNNAILTLGTGGSATFWFWQVNSDRSLTWQTNSGSWAWANTYTTAASQIPLNSWTHIAAVRSGSNFNMYINGSSAYSTAGFNAGSGASGTLFIGTYYANYNNDGSYFRGNISNLRIVRGTAVYTGNFSVPTAELSNITNTVLLICRSSTFIDNSTNAVTITPVNTPVISISTLFLGSSLGAFPASNYTATVVYPSLFGSRVILQGGDVALSTTIKAFDTEATGVRANVWSTGTAYGNRHVNWVTMTYNSPYSEGQVTGEEAAQPFTVYTRDATVNYGKVQWFVPEPTNLTQGQAISTSTVVVGVIGTSTYVRSTSTSSINAFRITPTTQIRNSFIPVTTDVGGIGVVETIYGGGPWSFTISGLQSVRGFTTGSIISSVARIGSAGQPGNVTYVTSIDTVTNSLTCGSYGSKTPSQGIINSVYPTGEFLPQLRITSITTLTGSSWFFNITGLRGTSGLVASVTSGTIITVTTASGSTGTVGSVSGNSLVVTSIDSQEQIKVFAYGGTTPFAGTITNIVTTSTLGSYPIIGDAEFLTPGIYTWVAPAGVTSVSAVAVGGGGAGFNNWSNAAGAGGGLGWRSSISVTSGTSYTVQVGAGGVKNGGAGGTSFFISTATVAGYGGGNASSGQNTSGPNANGFGGGYVGDGGGAGGNATNYAGGGGAGGYSGNGGNQGNLPSAGSGAAAGGGYYSSTYGTGAGGGVGLWGRAETATGWWHGSSGQVFSTSQSNGGGGAGGSGGTRGLSGENPTNSTGESGNVDGYGGTFGGGGGGPGTSWPAASGSGGKGGVRIIWGAGRSFPVNNAGTFTSVIAVTTLSTRSSLIGGPMNFWETQGIITNRMPYPESIAIDRLDTIVITDTITNDAATIKLFAFNNLSSYNAGSRSITNSLVGSETFFVAGTGTDGATSLSAYWI